MASNALSIRVLKFYTKAKEMESDVAYVDPKTGLPVFEDWVSYCPVGRANELVVNEKIERIKRIKEHGAVDNPAIQAARAIRDYIIPQYEAWKKHEEMPLDGTPLMVATFLREEDIDVLKKAGIRTLEEFRDLPDSSRDRLSIPRARELQAQAKRFIDAKDQNVSAAKMKAQEDTISKQGEELKALKTQMAALLAAKDEQPKRGPGRPRKDEAQAAA